MVRKTIEDMFFFFKYVVIDAFNVYIQLDLILNNLLFEVQTL
jgi:hypothetical protein